MEAARLKTQFASGRCPPRSITHDVPGSAIRNPPTRRCRQPGPSPAVNQPTTAVIVIDRIEELLLRIGRRPQPTGFYVDTDGVVRLIHPEPTWAETVDLAFTEIAIYGAPSPAVTRRLAAAYDRLQQSVPVDLRVAVARHRALLEPLASGAMLPEHPMATPIPDPRGPG